MKRVLVTGASGFVGRYLLPFLQEKGYEVFPCYNTNKIDLPSYASPVKVNILNQEERRSLFKEIKPSHLIHLAWYVNPLDYLTSVENVDWMSASIDLYKEFAKNGGKRCVSVGTCAEYDWSSPFLEEDKTGLESDTLYAFTKNVTHSCLERLSQTLNFEAVWARIFWLYGPGESPKRFIPGLISTLLKGEPFICKDPSKEIDLMHVKDVAYALSCALDDPLMSGALNVASGTSTNIGDIVKEVASILDCPHLVKFENEGKESIKIKASSKKILALKNFRFHYNNRSGLEEYTHSIKIK